MKRLRRKSSTEKGASTVEFALVAPLFFLLIFALIEGASLVYAKNTIGLALSDASRTAAIAVSDSTKDDEVVDRILVAQEQAFGARVLRIIIYKAEGNIAHPPLACRQGNSVAGVCSTYNRNQFANPTCAGWCGTARQPDDLIGIWVVNRYDGLTGLNPFEINWTDKALALGEPEL